MLKDLMEKYTYLCVEQFKIEIEKKRLMDKMYELEKDDYEMA